MRFWHLGWTLPLGFTGCVVDGPPAGNGASSGGDAYQEVSPSETQSSGAEATDPNIPSADDEAAVPGESSDDAGRGGSPDEAVLPTGPVLGAIQLHLTDAPADLSAAATIQVTIEEVRVHVAVRGGSDDGSQEGADVPGGCVPSEGPDDEAREAESSGAQGAYELPQFASSAYAFAESDASAAAVDEDAGPVEADAGASQESDASMPQEDGGPTSEEDGGPTSEEDGGPTAEDDGGSSLPVCDPVEDEEIVADDGGPVDDAERGKSGWKTVCSNPMEFDLMSLMNGVTTPMCPEAVIDAGLITQIRLIVSAGEVTWTDGREPTPLEIPSGTIKIVGLAREIGAEDVLEMTLDFDARESIHKAGQKLVMRPTIRVLP